MPLPESIRQLSRFVLREWLPNGETMPHFDFDGKWVSYAEALDALEWGGTNKLGIQLGELDDGTILCCCKITNAFCGTELHEFASQTIDLLDSYMESGPVADDYTGNGPSSRDLVILYRVTPEHDARLRAMFRPATDDEPAENGMTVAFSKPNGDARQPVLEVYHGQCSVVAEGNDWWEDRELATLDDGQVTAFEALLKSGRIAPHWPEPTEDEWMGDGETRAEFDQRTVFDFQEPPEDPAVVAARVSARHAEWLAHQAAAEVAKLASAPIIATMVEEIMGLPEMVRDAAYGRNAIELRRLAREHGQNEDDAVGWLDAAFEKEKRASFIGKLVYQVLKEPDDKQALAYDKAAADIEVWCLANHQNDQSMRGALWTALARGRDARVEEKLRQQREQAQRLSGQPVSAPLVLYRAKDALNFKPGEYILKGLMSPDSLSCWWGSWGTCKTFMFLDIAARISTATPETRIFGKRVKRTNVLFLSLEGNNAVEGRIQALLKHKYGDLDALFYMKQPINMLNDPGQISDLLKTIEDNDIGLVVVDTFNQALGGNSELENAGALLARLRQLIIVCPGHIHVAFVHHGGKDESRGPRGTSEFECNTDLVIHFEKDKGGALGATVVKNKDGPDGEVLPFWTEVVELCIDEDGDPVTTLIVHEGTDPKWADIPNGLKCGGEVIGKGKKMSDAQTKWWEALVDLFADPHGPAERRPRTPGGPEYRSMTREQVRSGLKANNHFACDEKGNITDKSRGEFRDALKSFEKKGKSAFDDDFIWMI